MAKRLSRPVSALCVLLAVILIFSFLGVNRSIAAQSRKVRRSFTEGVYLEDEGYTSASLYSHLKSITDDVTGVCAVTAGMDALAAETAALQNAKRAHTDALQTEDIPLAAESYTALCNAADDMETALSSLLLSERDAESLDMYFDGIHGAQAAVSANPYNTLVSDFESRVLDAFPTRYLRPLIFCNLPAAFN